jgi:hypothetical protein
MDRISLSKRHDHRGVALVIVLAFVVLLSGVVVAFFSRAMVSRHLSDSSMNQLEAGQLALSATDIIIGDLKQEIVDGSNPTGVSSDVTIYSPKSSLDMVPSRHAPDSIPNLIRSSSADPRASNVPSTAESTNGRSISNTRWNSHYLVPTVNDPVDSTPIKDFVAPDWVMVTSDEGPKKITQPDSKVIGRYAYAIYDEGGLLDANVAGYPSNSKPEQYSYKPGLAYADLTQLPISDSSTLTTQQVDNLVGWRNYATTEPGGSFGAFTFTGDSQDRFFKFVTSNITGFLKVSETIWNNRTDQVFPSRKALLDFCRATGFPLEALQYLGTFSRDINAPANLDLLKFRVTNEFTRTDGATARIGEPLLKRRFPLNRLAELASPSEGATIRRDFGLAWSTDHWNYVGSTGSTVQASITIVRDIAKEGREPNFFELLKAGIRDDLTDSQIIRIGANVIDQYDKDCFPTEISFGADTVYGIEDLPYSFLRWSTDGKIAVKVWNPHHPFDTQTTTPTKFEIRAATETIANFEVSSRWDFRDPAILAGNIDNRDMILEYLTPAGYREYHYMKKLSEGELAINAPDPRTDPPLPDRNVDSPPIVLNRPFRNVGELGYVFREPAWKNIDFFEETSLDAGLLDIFCVQETTTEDAMIAGTINLNTRQAPVLQSILVGGMVSSVPSPPLIMSVDEASSIAKELVEKGPFPFWYRSELVTKAASILKGPFQKKSEGEAALRALSDVGNTRTWNLMIDVIAQSGRYGPGQRDLSKFVVEGEKRYWVHVAIDRFTGKVVDKMMEAVYE